VCALGIEESFKKKCKLLVEYIDCLKIKIEELKRNEAEG
jgi:FtsZ-binding cell division protein ZapB